MCAYRQIQGTSKCKESRPNELVKGATLLCVGGEGGGGHDVVNPAVSTATMT